MVERKSIWQKGAIGFVTAKLGVITKVKFTENVEEGDGIKLGVTTT